MPLYRVALGYAIRSIRTQRGHTLRDIAERAPMALGYLSEVERGHKDISSELLETVAKGLGVTVTYIAYVTCEVLTDWEQQEKQGVTINACALLAELA